MSKQTYLDAVAALFKARPGEWISAYALQDVGGFGGWRTRVSNVRVQYGMRIDNRVVTQANGVRRSEYRFVPASLLEMAS